MVRMNPDTLDNAATNDVTTKAELGVVGKSSIEFVYPIFYGEQQVGTGVTNMVNVGGEPGHLKSAPVPARIAGLATTAESAERKLMMEVLKAMPKEAPEGAWTYDTAVRFSDEDVNKHANHASYSRFFEDAKEVRQCT